eukprot:m.51269 g.51269  ORF g.51269 m.51269 type:complete len:70 (-) comp9043_c0_seq2:15-224(-)
MTKAGGSKLEFLQIKITVTLQSSRTAKLEAQEENGKRETFGSPRHQTICNLLMGDHKKIRDTFTPWNTK